MIAAPVVQEIRRLLAEGKLSQRKIAERTGVSRGTVGIIAAGKRPDYPVAPATAGEQEYPELGGPLRRCPGCGGMVYWPCRLCEARAWKAATPKRPIPPWLADLDEPLGLDLREGDRARYERIHAEKVEADGPRARYPTSSDGNSLRPNRDDLDDAFGFEEDEWGLDAAAPGALSRSDLWDAFEWEGDEPAPDCGNLRDFDAPDGADDTVLYPGILLEESDR